MLSIPCFTFFCLADLAIYLPSLSCPSASCEDQISYSNYSISFAIHFPPNVRFCFFFLRQTCKCHYYCTPAVTLTDFTSEMLCSFIHLIICFVCFQLIGGESITNGLERTLSTGNFDIKRFKMHRKGMTQVLMTLHAFLTLPLKSL